MGGQPVWLASISLTLTGARLLAVPRWSGRERAAAEAQLRAVLAGVGNDARERLFRMNVSLCLHRAATDEEVAGQPAWFREAGGYGMAGGPVEILSETEEGSLSTRPCRKPVRIPVADYDPLLWVPGPCGRCPSCRARRDHLAAATA